MGPGRWQTQNDTSTQNIVWYGLQLMGTTKPRSVFYLVCIYCVVWMLRDKNSGMYLLISTPKYSIRHILLEYFVSSGIKKLKGAYTLRRGIRMRPRVHIMHYWSYVRIKWFVVMATHRTCFSPKRCVGWLAPSLMHHSQAPADIILPLVEWQGWMERSRKAKCWRKLGKWGLGTKSIPNI